MHPALSVIFFTVVSGAGFGLLFLVGVWLALDPDALHGNPALAALGVGALFAAAGLLSSMLHLGQPLRAWRAFSQWRSSWLSREGVASMASFVPLFALGFAVWQHADAAAIRVSAAVLAFGAVVTVCCTAKIYTTLKTIPAWNNAYVLPGYLAFALFCGSAWLWALTIAFGIRGASLISALACLSAGACGVLKYLYWQSIDTRASASTPETATGLGTFGAVSSMEGPHTEENYLTREMGFVLARKHSARLRAIDLFLLCAVPLSTTIAAFVAPLAIVLAPLAALLATGAAFVERWLFFAEAKHVVMLYYGRSAPQND